MKGFVLSIVLMATACLGATQATESVPLVERLQLEKHRGSVVVVDFWASWCTPCRRSFPWLNAMQAKYGDQGLVILGINVDSERAEADEFLSTTPADFNLVFDPAGNIAQQFEVMAMPSSFVIDRQGKIAGEHLGFKEANIDEYEALLVKVLANQATH